MRKPTFILTLVLLGLSLFGLLACESVVPPGTEFLSEQNDNALACRVLVEGEGVGAPLVVGAVLPLTQMDGKNDPRGLHRSQAMSLAFEEMNQRAGVQGRLFRFVACDTGSGWVNSAGEVARGLVTWLATEHGAKAILSGGSSDTLAMAAAAQKAGTVLMSVSGTSIEITDLDDDGLVWRVAPSDRYQGIALAAMVSETLAPSGGDRVAIFAIGNPYGDGLVKVLGDHLKGMKTHVYTLKNEGENLATELERAAKDKPDVMVVLTSTAVAADVVNGLKSFPALAKVALLFSDSAHNPEFLSRVTDMNRLKNARGTLPGAPVSPALKTFVERYESRYGEDPTQQSFTAHSYDGAYCLGLAHAWALGSVGKGKVDGATLALGLKELSAVGSGQTYTLQPTEFSPMRKHLLKGEPVDIEGASGALDFDPETGEAPSSVEIWKVGEGADFVSIKWVEVVEGAGGEVTLKTLSSD